MELGDLTRQHVANAGVKPDQVTPGELRPQYKTKQTSRHTITVTTRGTQAGIRPFQIRCEDRTKGPGLAQKPRETQSASLNTLPPLVGGP